MKEKITILGHENPDIDSILSGYILASFLRYKKYDAEYVIPDKDIDEDIKPILKYCGIDLTNFSNSISSRSKLILVDHHKTNFNNDIIAVIDHHPTISSLNCAHYINKPASSTTKHIYDIILKEDPKYISRRVAELVLIGMAVDTCSFRSSKSLSGDKEWFSNMCEKYSLNKEKIIEFGDSITDVSDINKASLNGCKCFNYSNKLVGTSYTQTYGLDDNARNSILNILKEKINNDEFHMWIFMDVNFKNNTSVVYEIFKDKIDIKRYDFIVSRALNIMPEIELRLSK